MLIDFYRTLIIIDSMATANSIKPLRCLTPQELDRFFSNLELGRLDECWNWEGVKNVVGHGRFMMREPDKFRFYGAHRIAFMFFNDQNPGSLLVCHRCDNPSCCNPTHLFLGTPLDNARDMVLKQRGAKGNRSGRRKLSLEQVSDIRERLQSRDENVSKNQFYKDMASEFGVKAVTIQAIALGRNWKHALPDYEPLPVPVFSPEDYLEPPKVFRGHGSDHPNSKLDDEKVREIRQYAAENRGKSSGRKICSALAVRYAVSRQAIDGIIRGKRWKHVPA